MQRQVNSIKHYTNKTLMEVTAGVGGTEKVFVEEVTFELSFEEQTRFRDERTIIPGREKSISKGMGVISDKNG